MTKRTQQLKVALIISDTLRRIGLEYCIREVTDGVAIQHFDHFSDFYDADEGQLYDVAFVESDQAALYRDYFRAKRPHLVVVMNCALAQPVEGIEETAVVCASAGEEEVYKQLQGIFAQYEKLQQNTDERALSPRELDVLKEVARGSTNKEIAEQLNISMNTVMSHRKNITAKLNIKTVSGLTFYALVNGIITGEELVNE